MFERFTESARRVFFYARYAAAQDQDSAIRCIHLLAGIERAASPVVRQVGLTRTALEALRKSDPSIQRSSQPIGPAVEMPLDPNVIHAVRLAQEAGETTGKYQVSPAHILWAVFYADKNLQARLVEAGVTEEKVAQACKKLAESERLLLVRSMCSGIGYDLHRLAEGRKLILGGVEVPFEKGPIGHSDGDVLSHAICDALLGAAALGDIGTHFPDTDPAWKNASSLRFLEVTRALLEQCGLRIAHIDAVMIAERPKLGPHFPAMRDALAEALGIEPEQINLKAKTNEGLGEIGRGEAIAAHAIATVEVRGAPSGQP